MKIVMMLLNALVFPFLLGAMELPNLMYSGAQQDSKLKNERYDMLEVWTQKSYVKS